MICIDTNILIYAHRAGTPEHESARLAIERAASEYPGWGIALPSVGEFWAQVTHPRYPGGPSSPDQAAGFFESLIRTGRGRLFIPSSGFPARLIETARALGVAGPRVFDIQIGLVALAGGATRLWTHDKGFVPLPGIRIEDPLGPPG